MLFDAWVLEVRQETHERIGTNPEDEEEWFERAKWPPPFRSLVVGPSSCQRPKKGGFEVQIWL